MAELIADNKNEKNRCEEFARLMHADIEKWKRVTREAGIQPQ